MPTKGAQIALDLYAASRVTTDMTSGIHEFLSPTGICITSKLPRAIDSAQALGFKDCIALDMFNESELPHPDRLLIPLRWGMFLLIYRLLWFLGFNLNCPGKLMDRKRAREGSNYLSKMAIENRSVLLVGHGIMNRLICSELKILAGRLMRKRVLVTGHQSLYLVKHITQNEQSRTLVTRRNGQNVCEKSDFTEFWGHLCLCLD